ncbi:GATS-like protein 1 [Chelonia mydas]|uniref:GATS-like protein 1 n=1 Tax=Chelonia mydas TaxID=8469 RepID=M7BYW5_CHEMY|nr:GATS-like protein 1 [Chelonia mydas]
MLSTYQTDFILRPVIHPLSSPSNMFCVTSLDPDTLPTVATLLMDVMFYSNGVKDTVVGSEDSGHIRFFSFSLIEGYISLVMDVQTQQRFPNNLLFTSASGELWKMVRIGGQPLGFDECGIVAQISEPLAASDIPAYYISTFKFDHALVPEENINGVINALQHCSTSLQGAEQGNPRHSEHAQDEWSRSSRASCPHSSAQASSSPRNFEVHSCGRCQGMKSSMDTSPCHDGLVNPTPRLAAFAVVIGKLCIALVPSWPVLSLQRFEDWKMELSTVPSSAQASSSPRNFEVHSCGRCQGMKSSMDTSPCHDGLVNPTPRLAAFAVVIGKLCIALVPSWPVLSLQRFEDWKMELSTVPRERHRSMGEN